MRLLLGKHSDVNACNARTKELFVYLHLAVGKAFVVFLLSIGIAGGFLMTKKDG